MLLIATLLAIGVANSEFAANYASLRSPEIAFLINDVLMSAFFLTVGMEINHERQEGRFSRGSLVWLPIVGALGGVMLPAVIFWVLNRGQESMRGWAIPTATDIAFALGILALLGKRIPPALRMFLLMVAIFDDIIAVGIIAIAYSNHLDFQALALAVVCVLLLWSYHRSRQRLLPFVLAGAALWISLLVAGIHPALSGVIIGVFLPTEKSRKFLLKMQPWVAYAVVPIFAFVNAGVDLHGLTFEVLQNPLPLGIVTGLWAGKQFGIFLAVWAVVRLGLTEKPPGISWSQLYGVCAMAGIGFTLSFFVGMLAFSDESMMQLTRIGVIVGSLASAVWGAIILLLVCPEKEVSNVT